MSKSFAMAGLRIGWLATRDRDLLARCAAFKDYTTICSSAPAEILALIGLRARDVGPRAIAPDRRREPRARLDRRSSPLAPTGSPGSARAAGRSASRASSTREPIDAFAARLVEAEGVLLLPGSQFGVEGNHFRIGFGREDLPAALAGLERFLDQASERR